MKKFIIGAILSLGLSSLLIAEEVLEHTKEVRVHSIPLSVVDSKSPVGYLNSQIIFISDQLERNLDKKYLSSAVLITSFLNSDDLTQTSGLGRFLSEGLSHELQVKGWKVVDARLVQDLIINESGEFALSRNIKNIKNQYNVSAIVTGTYVITDYSVLVNAKVIDIETGVMTSSAQTTIPVQGIENMLFDYSNAKPLRAVGSIDEVGSYSQPEMPRDDDGDGVNNEFDKCPDTPEGFRVDKDGCKVSFIFRVNFDFNSATLRDDYMASVVEFSKFLKLNKSYSAEIGGHADSLGTYEYNQALSEKRAKVVYDRLVKLGISKDRLSYKGFGELNPVASNLTLEDRAKNRRVEASLIINK